MKTRTSAVALVGLLALAACGAPAVPAVPAAQGSTRPASAAAAAPVAGDAAALLAQFGLAGKNAQQVVESLDQDPRKRPLPLRASVRPDRLVLSDGTSEASLPLTGERSFYLSVAPYVTRTHDCFNHSLATCQGELAGRPVRVTITDSAGAVLVDADRTTYANGFVAFWLPRNVSGTITVTADGRTGTVPFATKADSATCITTLKLT